MSSSSSLFPQLSVRNPWGFLIQNGYKKIENRSSDLAKEYRNVWIALHVSKTFNQTEQRYAQRYLSNHSELLQSNNYSPKRQQRSLTNYFGQTIKLSNDQKIRNLIDSKLRPQCGKIIAMIKFSECVNSQIGKEHDSIYCDQPFLAKSHWVISDVVALDKSQYMQTRGHMGCAPMRDRRLNDYLKKILNEKLSQRRKKHEIKEESDDDILQIMNDLDNVNSDLSQSAETNTKRQKKLSGNKRKMNENYHKSPPTKKLKKMSNQLKTSRIKSESNNFVKFSKKNSFYDMKRSENKIDLMITTEDTPTSTSNSLSDIEAELDAAFEETQRKKQQKKNISKESKVQKKIFSNPNEIARKQRLALPDKTRHRIIVFDTETATFKPEGVIIDIGAVELINGQMTGRKFQAYIKPWAKIHVEAMKVHGISAQFLSKYADGDIYQIIQSFMEWIHSDCICRQCQLLDENESDRRHTLKLVGHNVIFDVRQLNGAINYCQSRMSKEAKIWNNVDMNMTFDTQRYFREVMGNYGNYSLDAMCYKFGIKTDDRKHAHGALVDAMCTAKCLQEMWKRQMAVEERKCKNRFFTKKL